MEILSGAETAKKRADVMREQVAKLSFTPKLVIVRVGDRADSESYIKRKVAYAKTVDMKAEVVHFPAAVSQTELVAKVQDLNTDSSVNGIIVQLPLPEHLDEKVVIEAIDHTKDVDGLSDQNICKLFANESGVVPATPRGILTLLEAHDVPIAGKHVVVLGRSRLVGKSVSLLMLNQNATVTMCHSKTENLPEVTRSADILIVATGKQKFITAEHVQDGQTIIDVGIGADENGKIVGDVDADSLRDMDIKLSPVPGGVGPMTVASLFENMLTVIDEYQS